MDVVKRFGKAVYRSTIKIPLTAGYPVRNGSPDEANGSLASVVTIVFVTAMTFATIGIFGSKQNHEPLANKHIWIMMVSMVFAALASVVFISVLAYKNRTTWFKPSELKRIAIYTNIKVAFLWLFGFACILYESFNASMDLSCWANTETNDIKHQTMSELFSHFLQILCVCFQLSFITYFRYYKFEPSLCINYGILIILLANLSQWFESLVKEINTNPPENITISMGNSCFVTSALYNLTEQLEPYVGPARVEFFLLSTGFIISMWPSIQEDEVTETIRIDLGETYDEHSVLIPNSPSRSAPVRTYNTTSTAESHPHISGYQIHPVSHFCSIIVGMVLNVTLVIGNIVFVFMSSQQAGGTGLRDTWFLVTLAFKLCMLIMIYMIYYYITWSELPFNIQSKKLSSGQYLLVFATSGTVALCTIGIIVGIQVTPEMYGYIFIIENCVDIIGTYLQSVLIIHAEKLVVNVSGGTFFAVERLCLLLSVCNWSLWFNQSFIDVHYVAKFGSHHNEIIEEGTLLNIVKILSPVLIFYRFHVFLEWYNLHRKFTE